MSKITLRAGTSPFAHLLSSLKPGSKRADDEEQRQDANRADSEDGDPEDDEEARKARRAEEDELRQQEDARRAEEDDRRQEEDARRAEEDGDESDPDAEDDDDKKPDAEDDETEQKAEDEKDDDKQARARREGYAAAQARARRIFSSPAAAKRPDLAAHLACDETMPSAKAVAMLELAAAGEAPAASGSKLGRRMARVVVPNPGTGGTGASSKAPSFGEQARQAAVKAGIIKN